MNDIVVLNRPRKLPLDFRAPSSMCGLMDEEADLGRLVGELLVRAGMLMEDESSELIRQLPAEHDQIAARIATLAQVAVDLAFSGRCGKIAPRHKQTAVLT